MYCYWLQQSGTTVHWNEWVICLTKHFDSNLVCELLVHLPNVRNLLMKDKILSFSILNSCCRVCVSNKRLLFSSLAHKSTDTVKVESFQLFDMEGHEYNKQHKFPLMGTKNITVKFEIRVLKGLPEYMDLSLALVGYGSFIFQFHRDLPCPLKTKLW